MPVIVRSRCRSERVVLSLPFRIVISQGNKRGGADRDRIRAERQCFGNIGTVTDTTGENELNLAMHS